MFKLYSERNINPSELPDVYEYDKIPNKFRNQFYYILVDILNSQSIRFRDYWSDICYDFAREIGDKTLTHALKYGRNGEDLIEEFISSRETAELLDLIDFSFHYISDITKMIELEDNDHFIQTVVNGFIELNNRFLQNNLGYEFINGELIRIDNKHLHKEIIKPALHLLQSESFKGAEEEFLKAFEYRRNNDNKNAILEALKAFESTIKTICDKKSYPYNPAKDTAKNLIAILESNNFYPSYMSSHLKLLHVIATNSRINSN